MIRRCPVISRAFHMGNGIGYFTENNITVRKVGYTVHNFGKDITNLLNCFILTRSTLPLSLFLPPSLHLHVSSSHPTPTPLSPLSSFLCLSFTLSLSSFPLSFFLVPSVVLPPYLSSPPSFFFPPSPLSLLSILPSHISHLVFSPCYMHYLSILKSMTILINLSSSPSPFPLPISSHPSLPPPLSSSPPSLCFLLHRL